MLQAITFWTPSLFHKKPDLIGDLSETRKRWSTQLDEALEKGVAQIDEIWAAGLKANQKSSYSPPRSEIDLINRFYNGCDSLYLPQTRTATFIGDKNRSARSLITKLWYNTLKLFTHEHHITNLESRSFLDLGSLLKKVASLAQFSSFLLVNQYSIKFISSCLGINPALAGALIIASSITLSIAGIYLFHLYAERTIKKPLRDPSSGDTINLTKAITQSMALPEVGREVDIDSLETALSPPGAIVGVIGEAGAGKTEMAKFLAQRIASGSSIAPLKGLQLYYVNGAQVTRQYIEKFKEHIKGHESEIILCIDEAEGIYNASKAQNILKNAWITGYAPRLLLITTRIKYEASFMSEEDGSWQSRIQPCLNLKAISSAAMVPILYERLKSHFPWMKLSPQTVQPFLPLAQKCLRIAIRRLDNLAADFKRNYDSSPLLHSLHEQLQALTIEKAILRAGKSIFELSKDREFRKHSDKIEQVKEQIQEESKRLATHRAQLKQYQHVAELEKQWTERSYKYWLEHKKDLAPSKHRMILASSLWAGEVFHGVKSKLGEHLITEFSSQSIQKWLDEHPDVALAAPSPSSKQPLAGSSKAKGKGAKGVNPSPFIPSSDKPDKKSSLATSTRFSARELTAAGEKRQLI